MNVGFLGFKETQNRVFSVAGKSIPVTIVKYYDNYVTQIKTKEKDKYNAIQISSKEKKEKLLNKSEICHFAKNNLPGFYYSHEFRNMKNFELGKKIIPSDIFKIGTYVDVTSFSKGKGFSGNIKRHHHKIGPQSHGSGYHRGIGSMGPITQNRVFKQKKMPGQMGFKKVTVQNLQIVDINENEKYLLIMGLVPGAKNRLLIIRNAVKRVHNPVGDCDLFIYKKNIESKEDIVLKSKEEHLIGEQEKQKRNADVLEKEKKAEEIAKKRKETIVKDN